MARRALSLIGTGITVAGLVLAVALAGLLVGVPAASHGAALTVWTSSMEPAIPAGSIVVVRPVNPFRLDQGDVITYQLLPDDPISVTHRVVEVQADAKPPAVVTKGDANPSVDADPVEMQWIRGKVLLHIPYIGYAAQYLNVSMAMYAAAAAIVIWMLWSLVPGRKAKEDDAEAGDGVPPPTSSLEEPRHRGSEDAELVGATNRAKPDHVEE
jgi:signal peptidase I